MNDKMYVGQIVMTQTTMTESGFSWPPIPFDWADISMHFHDVSSFFV